VKEFITVMKALRDPNRVRIIKMLQHGELCVCEIQATLEISQPTVSKHVKMLEEAGLLSSRKDGLWVHYSLTDGGKSPYASALLGNLKYWLNESPEISEIAKKLPDIRRANLCEKCE
jgi:ArsR family transcriptional regulator